MKAIELREKTIDQLREELASLKKESFNLRFQQATGQLENTQIIDYKPTIMFNILSKFIADDKLKILRDKYNVYIHDYLKTERKNRKLGHITYVCDKANNLSEDIELLSKIIQ